MKIEGIPAYRAYKSYASASIPIASTELPSGVKAESVGKTDKVTFSQQAAQKGELGRLTQSIAAEQSVGVGIARLNELQEAVANREYYVSTDELADAILSTWG